MAINEWWNGDPEERYWLEITDRSDLGGDLYAPQRDQAGHETWSYDLVTHVNDGDFVLHWWKQPGQESSMVGYSHAAGSVLSDTITWQAHGTSGRASGSSVTGPAWRFPLTDYTDLQAPVELHRLRELEPILKTVRDVLAEQVDGPLYFPFAFSDKRPLSLDPPTSDLIR